MENIIKTTHKQAEEIGRLNVTIQMLLSYIPKKDIDFVRARILNN